MTGNWYYLMFKGSCLLLHGELSYSLIMSNWIIIALQNKDFKRYALYYTSLSEETLL